MGTVKDETKMWLHYMEENEGDELNLDHIELIKMQMGKKENAGVKEKLLGKINLITSSFGCISCWMQ